MSRDEYSMGSVDPDEGGDDAGLPGFLRDPIGVVKRRWVWMALILVAGFVAGGAFLRLREPVFRARGTVLVASQKISEQFVQATVETDQLEKVSAILGELLSRRQLAGMIEEHDLYPSDEGDDPLTMEEKVDLMRSQILIGQDRSNAGGQAASSSATVFEVVFSDHNPVKAAEVANDLAAGFTDSHLRMRSRQARLTTEFLRRELTQTEKELSELERKITVFKQTYRGQLPSELQTNLGRLDRLQSQRQSLALQIAEAESRLATLAASGTDLDPDSPEAILRGLQRRYKEQRSLYTKDHPNVVSLASQIAMLNEQIEERPESDRAHVGSVEAEAAHLTLIELRRQLVETVAEFEELDRRVALVPERHEELASMEQRAEILQESHREFLRKVNQAELAEAVESAQQGERATILDAAFPPTRPESSPIVALAAILIGSIGAAFGIAILLELIDAVLVTSDEIERKYGLPVLGSIPGID